MYRAYIEIKLKSGNVIGYANPNEVDCLRSGTEDDGVGGLYTIVPCIKDTCWFYTTKASDVRTRAMTSFSTVKGYIGTTGPFDITERHNNDFPAEIKASVVTSINKADIVAVEFIEQWVSSPANDREGAERFPRDSDLFQGTNDYANIRAEKITEQKEILDKKGIDIRPYKEKELELGKNPNPNKNRDGWTNDIPYYPPHEA